MNLLLTEYEQTHFSPFSGENFFIIFLSKLLQKFKEIFCIFFVETGEFLYATFRVFWAVSPLLVVFLAFFDLLPSIYGKI